MHERLVRGSKAKKEKKPTLFTGLPIRVELSGMGGGRTRGVNMDENRKKGKAKKNKKGERRGRAKEGGGGCAFSKQPHSCF